MTRNALLVGIDNYDGDPLAYCVNDARGVRDILEDPTYHFQCKILENSNATTRNIKEQLEQVLIAGTELALFYFAGHGVATDYGAYLITADCKERADEGIDMSFLMRLVEARSAETGGVVIILDCCQSGSLHIGQGSSTVALRAHDLSGYVHSYSDRRILLAACKENQFAQEDQAFAHGIFTHYLIEGLAGDAADSQGEVTAHGLYDHVANAFEKRAGQRPVCRGDTAGRIVLGSGLLSKVARKAADELDAVERNAEEHLGALQSVMANVIIDRTTWHNEGFRTACKQATPVIEWFNNRKREHAGLATRGRFRAAEQELLVKLQSLSQVAPGMRTEAGVIKGAVGSGTFGTVWTVETDHGLKALKVYHGADLGNAEKQSRFYHGFSAMRRLDHTRIIPVYNVYQCPLSFSMEYIDGANMRDWAGTIDDPQDLLILLQQIVDTLQHAHYRDVVHRDVKPENIIMKPGEQGVGWDPFLTDFDLAWYSTASIQTHDALGTVFYAAPEQLAKPGSASARAKIVDVYSIGQIFLYALTKSNPVPMGMADNVRALNERLKSWGTVRPAELMVQLYRDCTQHHPSDRIQTMEEVAKRLYDVRTAFSTLTPLSVLSKDAFAKEIKFAVVGLDDNSGQHEFMSPARHTKIALAFENKHLSIGFVVSRHPLVDNVTDYRKGREIVNQRLDSLLKNMPTVWRKSGRENPYEVFVNVSDLALHFSEVAKIRTLIVQVLGVLEKG